MNKLFGGIRMTWLRVIIFAVIAGLYTGVIMLISPLKDTSLQDIGISYEWWVVFAVIVVVNCQKNYEAMLKCFVFFLVSQPLVYIVEVVFGSLSVDLALNYYLKIWLPVTFLTIPGGFIAYYAKGQSILGGVILGLGNTILALMGVTYGIMAANDFPHHLLSALFSVGAIVLLGIGVQRTVKYRIISWVVPAVLTSALIVTVKLSGLYIVSGIY